MRVIFLGHACHLIESSGFRVLTDPWLTDPAFGGLIEHDPPLTFGIGDLPSIDAVAITHGHLDHFNAPTMAAFADKSIPVVHPVITSTELDRNLRALGFTNLHERDDWQPFELGGLRIVPTPSLGVLDECAYLFLSDDGGSFWNGADSPQVPSVLEEIRERYGRVELGALGHNSFDQPRLLGLDSFKDADHGPRAACEAARILGLRAAFPAASNMRWTGERGAEITAKVIRRSGDDFRRMLAAELPDVEALDLGPGDAWSSACGVERAVVRGSVPQRAAGDYIEVVLGRSAPAERDAATADTFRRELPALMLRRSDAARSVGQRVFVRVTGDDEGAYTVDFNEPGTPPVPGDHDADFAFEIPDADWKGLFARRVSWQTLIMSDRLRVTRLRQGPPPDGLNFVYALQALFP